MKVTVLVSYPVGYLVFNPIVGLLGHFPFSFSSPCQLSASESNQL